MGYYIVVDFEMCRVPRSKRKLRFKWSNETIQIGAVMVNEKFEIIDEFNTYVQPEYGCLDWYISDLTGICTKELKGAPKMDKAVEQFIDWIPENSVVVSWSDNDLHQMRHEVEAKNISNERLEGIFANWLDCQKMFSDRFLDNKICKLSEALIAADIIPEGRVHNGLADAHNTAKLFAKMMSTSEMKLNDYYESALSMQEETLSFSLADLLGRLQYA